MAFPIVKMRNKTPQNFPFPLHDVDPNLIQEWLGPPIVAVLGLSVWVASGGMVFGRGIQPEQLGLVLYTMQVFGSDA